MLRRQPAVACRLAGVTRPSGRACTGSAGPNMRLVQPAGDQQQRVVERLGVEPPQRHPRQERVVRVEPSDARASRPTPAGRPGAVTISRCIALRLQPCRDELDGQPVEQLGCVGGAPALPKLSSVATMPAPKWCFQTRLTTTRAVSGWSGRGQPAGERQPPAGRRRAGPGWPDVKPAGPVREDGGHAGRAPRRPGDRRRPEPVDIRLRREPVSNSASGCRQNDLLRLEFRNRSLQSGRLVGLGLGEGLVNSLTVNHASEANFLAR